jgi:hypothetical protein
VSAPFGPTLPGPNGGQPPALAPQPVPTQVFVGQIRTPQGALVVLQVATPVGVAVYFLDPEAAIRIGQMLRQCGKASKAGIVLPSEGEIG